MKGRSQPLAGDWTGRLWVGPAEGKCASRRVSLPIAEHWVAARCQPVAAVCTNASRSGFPDAIRSLIFFQSVVNHASGCS